MIWAARGLGCSLLGWAGLGWAGLVLADPRLVCAWVGLGLDLRCPVPGLTWVWSAL
jgi:hypothetical protein